MASRRSNSTLVAVSVVHAGQRVDMAVPAEVPLAELLPGLVSALGRLTSDAATQGFRVIMPSGRELDQGLSLAGQGVSSGAVLSLEVAGGASGDVRYDDIVEAIGASVDGSRTPWRRGDSVGLSAYSASGLFGVAAALLVLGGADSVVAAIPALVGAGLVGLAAMVLVRLSVVGGAVALTMTVPLLVGAAGFVLAPDSLASGQVAVAGVGVLLGSVACLLLPRRHRAVAAGPVVAGLAALLVGGLGGFASVPLDRAAALAVALVTVTVLLAPWLGLAQIPAHIDAISPVPRGGIDGRVVAAQLGAADVAVLATRVAAGLVTASLAPLVATTPAGALLMACVGLAFLLGTRSLYGRAEVLAGVVGGLVTLVVAGVTSTIAMPGLLPWLVGLTVLVGGFVLAWNVISVGLRPWLTRAADGLHVVALMAVLPLTLLVWGLA